MPGGQLRIRGVYDHMDQADFLLYSMDGGLDRIDTLHIKRGEFEYTTELEGKATFHILYPNNDELVIWAGSGDDVVIEGEAQNLSKVKVSGNEENELYTSFRQELEATDTLTVRRAAAAFIRQHPESPVARYLFENYFVLSVDCLPKDSVKRLYKVLQAASPKDDEVLMMGGCIEQRYALQEGVKLPDFDLVAPDSTHIRLTDYKGKRLLLYFWAGWLASTQEDHRIIADTLENHKDLRAVSYSLDVDSATFSATRGDSTLHIPTYCDYQGFQSELAKDLGVNRLPLAILVDGKGKIIKMDKDLAKVLKASVSTDKVKSK